MASRLSRLSRPGASWRRRIMISKLKCDSTPPQKTNVSSIQVIRKPRPNGRLTHGLLSNTMSVVLPHHAIQWERQAENVRHTAAMAAVGYPRELLLQSATVLSRFWPHANAFANVKKCPKCINMLLNDMVSPCLTDIWRVLPCCTHSRLWACPYAPHHRGTAHLDLLPLRVHPFVLLWSCRCVWVSTLSISLSPSLLESCSRNDGVNPANCVDSSLLSFKSRRDSDKQKQVGS